LIKEQIKNEEISIQTAPFGIQFKAVEYLLEKTLVLNDKDLGYGKMREGIIF